MNKILVFSKLSVIVFFSSILIQVNLAKAEDNSSLQSLLEIQRTELSISRKAKKFRNCFRLHQKSNVSKRRLKQKGCNIKTRSSFLSPSDPNVNPSSCSTGSGNSSWEWIKKVVLNAHSKSSGASAYTNYRPEGPSLSATDSLFYNIEAGYRSGSVPWNLNFHVFLDHNKDGIYSAGERIVYRTGKSSVGGGLSLPQLTAGEYGVRVILSFGAQFTHGCPTGFFYGEIEDYSLHVTSLSSNVNTFKFIAKGNADHFLLDGENADLDHTNSVGRVETAANNNLIFTILQNGNISWRISLSRDNADFRQGDYSSVSSHHNSAQSPELYLNIARGNRSCAQTGTASIRQIDLPLALNGSNFTNKFKLDFDIICDSLPNEPLKGSLFINTEIEKEFTLTGLTGASNTSFSNTGIYAPQSAVDNNMSTFWIGRFNNGQFANWDYTAQQSMTNPYRLTNMKVYFYHNLYTPYTSQIAGYDKNGQMIMAAYMPKYLLGSYNMNGVTRPMLELELGDSKLAKLDFDYSGFEASTVIYDKVFTAKPHYIAWHNQSNRCDVNGDGWVSPIDQLALINYANANGWSGNMPENKMFNFNMVDVNGDGRFSSLDLLTYIDNCQ